MSLKLLPKKVRTVSAQLIIAPETLLNNMQNTEELPTKASIDKVDKLRFRDFLQDVHQQEYPDS
ncbi:MAG: hypothetical protein D3922_14910, partial [Candidatus Electrothrix sp. AR1]|nr:hypothetical protein [Candidatus Electrothrix sp. AR1]